MWEICPVCSKTIEGRLEILTAINHGHTFGSTYKVVPAHFYCHYPEGVEDHSLDLPAWAFEEVTRLASERARYFRVRRGL